MYVSMYTHYVYNTYICLLNILYIVDMVVADVITV